MGYAYPTNTDWVSCSWQCHVDRTPPSGEPGTDYGAAYGTPMLAVESGVVTYIRNEPIQSQGRYVEYRLDDGRTTRSLHMSRIVVSPGQRVSRGQKIGEVGGSGYGDDWYYGPHDHQTLWPGDPWVTQTIDFDTYVGDAPTPDPTPTPTPDPEEDEVTLRMMHWTGTGVSVDDPASKLRRAIFDSVSGYWMEWTESGATYANNMARNWQTGSSAEVTRSLASVLYQSCRQVRPSAAPSSSGLSADADDNG